MTSVTSTTERRVPRVVVLGAGFAGLAAVRQLNGLDAQVLLVDRNPYNTFQPLLYQVATGGLNPGDVTYSLRSFTGKFKNARFRHGTAVGVDRENKTLLMEDGDHVEYDYLILGTGIAANYFGIPGAEENTLTMYTRRGAIEVRDRLFTAIETAAEHPGSVSPSVVVVGAGPTGAEMAGAIAELRDTYVAKNYPDLDPSSVRVVVVEMLDVVLGPFADDLRQYAAKALKARGVELELGEAVAEVREDTVVVKSGKEYPSALTVWASGVSAPKYLSEWGLPQGRGGRIQTGPDLRIQGSEDIFAVGDVGAVEGNVLPQLAQPAIQTGRHAAAQVRNLVQGQPTKEFAYDDKGFMAIIGRGSAVAQLKWPVERNFTGLVGWLMWMGLHLALLPSNRNRIAAAAGIASHFIFRQGGNNVIQGDARPLPQNGRQESDEPKTDDDASVSETSRAS